MEHKNRAENIGTMEGPQNMDKSFGGWGFRKCDVNERRGCTR